jgi:hypothetical protein
MYSLRTLVFVRRQHLKQLVVPLARGNSSLAIGIHGPTVYLDALTRGPRLRFVCDGRNS